ncbi:hypothetical protein TRIP_B300036 [uncultured Desulfatiglans sp.]|nr:hypothetical protein TRIP_B300036 [uncultured Desulfatiglans sp.]
MKANKITFLGIDGSGKSTLARMLTEYLEAREIKVTLVPFHKWVFADFFRPEFRLSRHFLASEAGFS